MPLPFTAAHALGFPQEQGEVRVVLFEREDALFVVIADGAGGLAGGGIAAELLIEVVRGTVVRPGFDPLRPDSWLELLADADVALEADPHAGETTAVAMAVSNRGVIGASAGDSGAWIIGADAVDDLTAGQYRKLRLGSGRALPVSFSRAKLEGTLLVATDGLFNFARAERIAAVVGRADLEQAVHELVRLARLPSGGLQDDVGVVLVRGRS